MPDFRTRSTLPERMDASGVSETEIGKAMREIERINKWLGGNKIIQNALSKLSWPKNAAPVTIMDLGCGGGDILRMVSNWGKKHHKSLRLIGVDINPIMTRLAGNHSRNYEDISFISMDVFDPALNEERPDIMICSLFTHHFDDEALIILLHRMNELSKRFVIINDLDRHWFAYYAIKLLTLLFRSPQLVRYDGPLSVARSLKRLEWESALKKAGIESYTIRWRWAWRWEIIIKK